jgi:hypothetical protein
MRRPKLKLAQILFAMGIVALGLAFPFVAFWAIQAISILLFMGNVLLVLWLFLDGSQPVPRPVRLAIKVAHYSFVIGIAIWFVSVGWKLQYDGSWTGSVVLNEHAIGMLNTHQLNVRSGWTVARSQSNRVRIYPFGGTSGSGPSWESHLYVPLMIPVALSISLLVLNYSVTAQKVLRDMGSRAYP